MICARCFLRHGMAVPQPRGTRMRLFLLGATGRTGKLVLQQALARGHAVTAIVRAASALDTFNTHASRDLRIVVGNRLASEALAPHLRGHDVLISCLGQRSRPDATVLHRGAPSLDAMARSGIRRYLVISQGLLSPAAIRSLRY
jgi:putative NADH-flavin reductase